ncbi:THA2 [Symbiodinium sp. KB8]|nr:THA2 [Symbiodinium sp. KB8]
MTMATMDAATGDDVMGEDPSVIALEKTAAEMLGKEAALFLPSGTMGNLCGVMSLASSSSGPTEVLVGDESHMFHYELGGLSTVAGLAMSAVPTSNDGTLALEALGKAVREEDVHHARTAVVCLENTHNRMGGRALGSAYMRDVGAFCRERGLLLHVDGARLFNAAAALGESAAALSADADTVSICLSKGLGAPVGSVLAGSLGTVALARRYRKMLGGGMRQAGVIAAPGLLALRENSTHEALRRDHRIASSLAAHLRTVDGVSVAHAVETNIVYADVSDAAGGADGLIAKLRHGGVLASAYGTHRVRFVTHRQVPDDAVDRVMKALEPLA